MFTYEIEMQSLYYFQIYLIEQEKSRATIGKYTHDIKYFIDFVKDDGEITKRSILNYKIHLGNTYAVASANSMIAALNCFLRFCGRHELCIKQFRIQRQAYCSEEKELSKNEYVCLLSAARKKNNKKLDLIIQTICGTGIRVSELQHITVEALKNGEAVVNCKGKNRRIFIVNKLRKKLLCYAKEQNILSGAIFLTKNGKPISLHKIWRDMKSLCAEANISPSKVFPHNLRHLFARTFYSKEKDIAKLADILGHASINTTRTYIITTGAEHRRQMENMCLII